MHETLLPATEQNSPFGSYRPGTRLKFLLVARLETSVSWTMMEADSMLYSAGRSCIVFNSEIQPPLSPHSQLFSFNYLISEFLFLSFLSFFSFFSRQLSFMGPSFIWIVLLLSFFHFSFSCWCSLIWEMDALSIRVHFYPWPERRERENGLDGRRSPHITSMQDIQNNPNKPLRKLDI